MTKTVHKANNQRSEVTEFAAAASHATATRASEHKCEAASASNQQPTDVCEEAIRTLAHEKWELAGCPAGDGVEFWLDAEQEVNQERSKSNRAQG